MRTLRRVAIVDHLSFGGVSRFLLALITHLASAHPETEFVYFVAEPNIERDDLRAQFAAYANVRLRPIASPMHLVSEETPQPARGPVWRGLVRVLKAIPPLHRALRGAYVAAREGDAAPSHAWWDYRMADDVIAELEAADVVYVGWPRYNEAPELRVPVVCTFHDFHFRKFPEAYGADELTAAERQTAGWLRASTVAITSTEYIRDELLGYYPDAGTPVDIVYLAPYGFERPTEAAVDEAVERFGVTHPFVLYGGGYSAHKNLPRLVEAIGALRREGLPAQLVITGAGSDRIGRGDVAADGPVAAIDAAIERAGLTRGDGYQALGYVTNAEVDALTTAADLVVSPSLYEAGCGPALDAWQAGTPIAFSNIPPFVEQMKRFGVQAWVFDPEDAADMAATIRTALADTEGSARMVATSLSAIGGYNWEDVAREYYRVFTEAAERGPCHR